MTRVDTANVVMYDQLCERLTGLEQHLMVPPPEPYDHVAYQEACVHQTLSRKRWKISCTWPAVGHGHGLQRHVNRIHRVEEAHLQFASTEVVIGQAIYDEGRLRGAPIDNWKCLIEQLRRARNDLELVHQCATAKRVLEPAAEHGEYARNPIVISERAARAQLRAISYLINRFRGERWDALARARVQLDDTAVLTGVIAYAILVIVLMTGVTTEQTEAATIFFLVGAVVGLFNRLLGDLDSDRVIEDYGLHKARLLHTPLYSGLAALGGILIIGDAAGSGRGRA